MSHLPEGFLARPPHDRLLSDGGMEDESQAPETPTVPPPDLPKPSIPPPDLPKPPPVEAAAPPPPVKVAIRQPGDPEPEPDDGTLAPFNTRVIAALIDVVISMGLYIAAVIVLPGFVERAAGLLSLGYLIARDSVPFLGGQSVGKRAVKLKVVTLEDKPIVGNWEVSLIRNGVLLIPFFGLVELFVLLTREGKSDQGRRLGDEWAKTKVVISDDSKEPDEEA